MGQSQSSHNSEPGARYRAKAAQEARARAEASHRSQAAFESSNHRNAKAHSQAARSHQQKVVEYNALASSEIFRHYNPNYPSSGGVVTTTGSSMSFFAALFSFMVPPASDLSRLDLHGQHVKEAIPMVENHLERCRRESVERTTIITGRGAHSVGGVPKIKPEVEGLLVSMGVKHWKEGKGAYVVECKRGARPDGGIVGWIWRGIFG
ncbi:Smr-domain-containing protein [Choiromyces venosus 120613-1]|uniref:Smr-domain-containing protein n=1 Tax=Choiromyces venosus 120613-1 TaxID=1336337 RepID=A0A3N4JZR9_9PEZI|nr:Smr-domain-containing protein [Choiromyces venosus 120613-1]